ncbi:MAG: helix-turn-helix domain-containing protein [Candidatus Gastranaerophilales bacterium]|nr:helix-turn-helix domain-containing protein [Candidatus Gastranaerophilales bacterium]
MHDIIENLKELGFNTYEAKVYLALLKKYPATGYEISRIANIPQSRTYDTLKVLEKEKIVTPNNSKPVTYTPIKPKALTKRFKRKLNSTLDFLDKNLPNIKDDYTEPIMSISGNINVREKIIEVIQHAKKEIFIEVWSQDFKFIEPYLLDAYNRGLEIKIVGYDNFKSHFGLIFEHGYAKEIEASLGGRMIIIAIDNETGLFGSTHSVKEENVQVIYTENTGIVFLLKEFIVHDMYLIDVETNLSEQIKTVYGKNLKSLRDKILGPKSPYMIH